MKGGGAQSQKWLDSGERSRQMFEEAGVKIEWYNF
jgi:hypothetical protein